MKRKFLSIISFVLALTMILPMGIFVSADGDETDPTPEPTEPIKLTLDGEDVTGKTVTKIFSAGSTFTVSVTGGSGTYNWYSKNTSIAEVSGGTVTPKDEGIVEICVEDSDRNEASVTFNFQKNSCTGITVADGYKKDYISGQSFDKSSLSVTASYKDETTKPVSASDLTVEPSGALRASDKTVTVSYGEHKYVIDITVTEKTITKVEIINATTKYTEGDTLPELEVLVTYNDNTTMTVVSGYDYLVNGTKVNSSYTFKTTDKTIAVSLNGISSSSVSITVSPKQDTAKTVTLSMIKAPTKTTYKVGEKFDSTGMTIKVVLDNYEMKTGEVRVSYSAYTITEDDLKNKNDITISATVTDLRTGGKIYYNVPLTVTGLTITEAAESLTIYEIASVVMEKTSYPIGYKISLDDIDYITYKETRTATKTKKIENYDLTHYYADEFSIEVVDEDGDTKSRRQTTIEEDDVYDYKASASSTVQCVNLMVTSESATRDEFVFRVKVGGSGVYYYYDDDLIAVYDDIDDALKYTMEQDDDVEDDFELDDVRASKSITLKLLSDQKISKSFDLELCHNVVIDLNGHSLTFYTDTVDITKTNKDYTLTITNTSKTAGTFIYYDESITMTVAEDDKLVFEYDEDIPGIYTVTVSAGANGTVTSTPKITNKDEIKVGHGSDIKFTITPKTDYALDTIKVDSKTVSEKDYTTSASGVVSYTLKAVGKSQKVEITFKKVETVKTWKNPFTDVSATDSYYSAVKFVYENELFNGTSTTKFSPDTTMTRAMFVTVLGRLAGVDVSRFKTSSYSDVPINSTTSWYAPYVEWATQMGLVEGYGDGTFGPNNKITRQQMYVLMYRYTIYVENQKVTLSSESINASDAEEVADWAYDAVKFASQKNFLVRVNGTASRIGPTGEAKRSELAQLLEKYCITVLNWENK